MRIGGWEDWKILFKALFLTAENAKFFAEGAAYYVILIIEITG